jgi:hypothetical protein
MGHSRVDESRKFCSFRSSYLWDTSEELLQLGAGTFFIFLLLLLPAFLLWDTSEELLQLGAGTFFIFLLLLLPAFLPLGYQ